MVNKNTISKKREVHFTTEAKKRLFFLLVLLQNINLRCVAVFTGKFILITSIGFFWSMLVYVVYIIVVAWLHTLGIAIAGGVS